jgi:AraC-like DNA-binding protein
MQAILRKIDSNDENSFVARIDTFSHFYDKWHFHPELELTHIVTGRGTRFVGDNIEFFEDDDLVLIGSNMPHVWKDDLKDIENKEDDHYVKARVIQFLPEFFGSTFLKLREMENIRNLIEKAQTGLKIQGNTKISILTLMTELFATQNKVKKLCVLLEILECLAISKEVVSLSSKSFVRLYHKQDSEKINRIYEFTLNQYYRKILISEVSSIVNMSVPNFCKFFKSRTPQKTYIKFLTEVRIGYACRMLAEDKKSIQQIAIECGFNNMSNFNRAFRLLKGKTPVGYRQAFAKIG